MRMNKFCQGLVGLALLALAACGGSSTTPAAQTTSPTATPAATPGALQIAYTSNFGASSAATAAPAGSPTRCSRSWTCARARW